VIILGMLLIGVEMHAFVYLEASSSGGGTPCSFAQPVIFSKNFSLKTNQATLLFSQNKPAPATSQTNSLQSWI
jgi:hypothetical protein